MLKAELNSMVELELLDSVDSLELELDLLELEVDEVVDEGVDDVVLVVDSVVFVEDGVGVGVGVVPEVGVGAFAMPRSPAHAVNVWRYVLFLPSFHYSLTHSHPQPRRPR